MFVSNISSYLNLISGILKIQPSKIYFNLLNSLNFSILNGPSVWKNLKNLLKDNIWIKFDNQIHTHSLGEFAKIHVWQHKILEDVSLQNLQCWGFSYLALPLPRVWKSSILRIYTLVPIFIIDTHQNPQLLNFLSEKSSSVWIPHH